MCYAYVSFESKCGYASEHSEELLPPLLLPLRLRLRPAPGRPRPGLQRRLSASPNRPRARDFSRTLLVSLWLKKAYNEKM